MNSKSEAKVCPRKRNLPLACDMVTGLIYWSKERNKQLKMLNFFCSHLADGNCYGKWVP